MNITKLAILLLLSLASPLSAQTAWIIYDAAGQLVANPSGGSVFATKAAANAVVDCGFQVIHVDLSVTPAVRTTVPLRCALPTTTGGTSGSIPPTGSIGGSNIPPADGQVVISGSVDLSGVVISGSSGGSAAVLSSTLSEVCDDVSVPNPDVSLQEAFGDGFLCYFKASPADRTN